jgi:hypothetical protein
VANISESAKSARKVMQPLKPSVARITPVRTGSKEPRSISRFHFACAAEPRSSEERAIRRPKEKKWPISYSL